MANSNHLCTGMGFCKAFLLLAFFFFISSSHILTVVSIEFQVDGTKGWVIPPANDDQFYNDWASKNRFNVNDTLHFAYKKDSVVVVTKEAYEKCRSVHPSFFSNNGNTAYTFDRSGLFYFISGVSGHCERAMKMIIKVLEMGSPPHQSANQTASDSSSHTSGAFVLEMVGGAKISPTLVTILISFFGVLFM